ncbi:hypothetical protein FPRO04_12446 [Fusarium proliferatum]|nr:hypothetical protein FPRO04_12446 [Fusarium proliferatum]
MRSRKPWKACSTCRRRKVKCDIGRPYQSPQMGTRKILDACSTCRQRKLKCDNGRPCIPFKPNVLSVLRKAMPMLKRGGEQRMCRGHSTIEILLSETRQSAELSLLRDGRVCITAEFFGEAPGEEVGVALWKIADGTNRQLGPATRLGSTRWCVVMDHNDLIGHAVIFTRRQREEVISVPVPSEPNKSPFLESTSSSVPIGSAVGSPTAWMYTYGVGTSAWTDILIEHNSVYYTYQASKYLRSRLLNLVEQQAEQARRLQELWVKFLD